jgi:hypothetical protein
MTTVAKRDGDDVVRHAGNNPDRKVERAPRVLKPDHLSVRKTRRLGCLRADHAGLSHVIFVSGSGIPASHASFANRPS